MIVELVVSVVLALLSWAVYSFYRFKGELARDGIPMAGGAWPILFHLPSALRSINVAPHGTYGWFSQRTLEAGNKAWGMRLPGMTDTITLVDSADVTFVLNDIDSFPKGKYVCDLLYILLGDGIFNVDGEQWRQQRKAASHMFTVNSLRYMDTVFERHAHILIDRLGTSLGTVVDAQELFAEFTLCSFTEIAFGFVLEPARLADFALHFNRATRGVKARWSLPFWQYIPYKSERLLKIDTDWLKTFAADVVRQRRAEMAAGTWTPNGREDLLARMMSLTSDDVASGENDIAREKALYDYIINFILAGRDTTAQTLTWVSWLLSRHPASEAKLVAELREAFPPGSAPPSYDSLRKLRYLHACVNEALRLYPPVPFDSKEVARGQRLPSGVMLREKQTLLWSAWIMGRDETHWHEAERFSPERWEGPEYNGGKPLPPSTGSTPPFVPFQAGPRMCLGIQMAYSEIKLLIALLYLNGICFRSTSGKEPLLVRALTMSARDGVPLIPERL